MADIGLIPEIVPRYRSTYFSVLSVAVVFAPINLTSSIVNT